VTCCDVSIDPDVANELYKRIKQKAAVLGMDVTDDSTVSTQTLKGIYLNGGCDLGMILYISQHVPDVYYCTDYIIYILVTHRSQTTRVSKIIIPCANLMDHLFGNYWSRSCVVADVTSVVVFISYNSFYRLCIALTHMLIYEGKALQRDR
jgi:hypothetical protein